MIKHILLGLTAIAVGTGAAQAKELTSIGVSVGSLGNSFFVAMDKGIKDRAKQINPDVKVTTVAADYDLNKQFSQIDNFIAAKVDLILVDAADPKAIQPAVKRAQDAGIPVIAIDQSAAGAIASVQTDNVKAGRMACDFLSSKLEGKGKVIIINGPPVSTTLERVQGCKEALAKGKFEILSDNQNGKASRDGGLAVGLAVMTRFQKFDGIFAINDLEATGADLAAKQLGRGGFLIVGVDGSPEAVQALKTNTLMEGSVAQDPYAMAVKAVDVGNEILKTGKAPANPTVLLDPSLLTRANVSSYKGWSDH